MGIPLPAVLLAAAVCLLAALLYYRKLSTKPIDGLPVAPGPNWLLGNINLYMDFWEVSLPWAKTLGHNISIMHPMAGASLLTTSTSVVDTLFKDR